MKKYLSVFLALTLIFQSMVAAVNAEGIGISFLFYEDFDSYATNERIDGAVGTAETRVIENGEKNKGLLLSANEAVASYRIEGIYKSEFVVEMDVKRLSEGINAEILSIGTNSVSMPLYKVGRITAYVADGRPVNGFMQNSVTKVAAKINLDKGIYSVYVNGKCLLSDYPLPQKLSEITVIKSTVMTVDGMDSEILIDNVRIYSGNTLKNKAVKSEYNTEVMPYPSDINMEEIAFNKVFLEDFEIYEVGETTIKESYISEKNEGNSNFIKVSADGENKYHHYYRHTTDPLINYITTSNANDLVAEYTIFPKSITSSAKLACTFIGKNAKGNFGAFTIDYASNIVLADGTNIGKINMGEWNRVAFVFRQDEREYDILLNNKVIASGLKFPNAEYMFLQHIRLTASGSGIVEFYVDNVACYEGNKPVDSLDAHIKAMYDSYHIMTEDEVLETCGDMFAFSIWSDRAVVDKKLLKLSERPVIKEDKYYVPEEMIKASTLKAEELTSTEINGVKYYSADEIADKLGYKKFADLGDFVILSADADQGYLSVGYYWERKLLVQYETPKAEEIIADFKKTTAVNSHPRLIFTADDFGRIRGEMESNPFKKELYDDLLLEADKNLSMANPVYVLPDGVRLAVHDWHHPAVALAFAYWMTGDLKYAEKAKDFVLAVTQFNDWNPRVHYLDVGVCSSWTAICYDWLYHLFTEDERKIVEEGITRNALDTAYSGFYNGEFMNFPRGNPVMRSTGSGNWMSVIMGGTILSALAVMEKNPEYSAKIIESAIRNLRNCLPGFQPDGAWEEGGGYWGYTLNFFMYTLESLKSSLGTCYNYDKAPGIDKTGYFTSVISGSMGAINYGDSDEGGATAGNWILPWLGYINNDSELHTLRYKDITLNKNTPQIWDVAYLDMKAATGNVEMQLDRHFGEIDTGSMRSEYFNNAATFVGYHAGSNQHGHMHYDTGMFVFDALGVRWAYDLGMDEYNLSTYNSRQDTAVYRRRAEGQNVFVINPDEFAGQTEYNANDCAERYESNANSAYVILDLSESYSDDAISAKRGLKLGESRNTFLLRDEIEFKEDDSVFYWFMNTRAEVTVEGNTAYLKQRGQTMKFEFISNQPLTLGVMDAKPLPTSPIQEGQNPNEGLKKIVINGTASGKLSVTVKMSPVIDGVTFEAIPDVALENWALDAPVEMLEKPALTDLKIDGETVSGFTPERKNYSFLTATAGSEPKVEAFCLDEYKAEVKAVRDGGLIYQILITAKNNPMIYTLYTLNVKQLENTNIKEGERFAAPDKFYASAEPQTANAAVNIFDGDQVSRWSAQGENYMIYEFKDVVNVSAIDMSTHESDKRSQFFSLLVSLDGVNYTEIINTKTAGDRKGLERFELGGVQAKYIKLNCTKTTVGDWNSITELYVYTK